VDCTGDGDLAAWAGASFEKGDKDGLLQAATHCFVITNVDEYAFQNGPGIHFFHPQSPMPKAIASDKYPLIIERHSCNMQLGPGTVGFNTGHIYDVDNTDPVSLSKALITGRRMAVQYRDAFAEFLPSFANSFLAATGGLMGIRETRRITGDYVLCVDDFLAARHFDDEICRNAYGVDVHGGSREAAIASNQKSVEEIKARKVSRPPEGDSMGVPYRCLTPKGLKNVLVAGRCISSDRQANGSVRIMACCLNTGEAAGIAAAMATTDKQDVHAVDTDDLRKRLREYGAFLP